MACSWFPVGFRPPAFASWTSRSRQRIPPSSQLAYQARHQAELDFVGVAVFHTREIRPGWVPSSLRGDGAIPAAATSTTGACRFPTASPLPRHNFPSCGGWDYEAYEDSLTFTRPVFPFAHHPRMERERLRRLPRALHPTVTRDAHRGGDGPL